MLSGENANLAVQRATPGTAPRRRSLIAALPLAALLSLLLAARADSGQDEARRWLERMIEAAHTLNYEGTFVYVQGQHVEAMRITHSSGAAGEQQRMFSLSGLEREVVVANNQVTCTRPANPEMAFQSTVYRRSPLPLSLPKELGQLEHQYRFELLGEDRVAGKKSRIVVIKPRDALRFGYRFWLDNETGMVLRSALVDEGDRVLEQLMFTELQFKAQPDPQPPPSTPSPPAPEPAQAESQVEQVEQSSWTVTRLPAGFSQVMHNRFKGNAVPPHPAEHLVFTDGLATVSVFLEPLGGAEPLLEGPAHMGAMNAFGKVIEDHQLVVVGEVPQAAVAMIAASVKFSKAGDR